jgi:hypothetical protein
LAKVANFLKKKPQFTQFFLKKIFINQRNLPPKKSIDWNLVRSKNSFHNQYFIENYTNLLVTRRFSRFLGFFSPGQPANQTTAMERQMLVLVKTLSRWIRNLSCNIICPYGSLVTNSRFPQSFGGAVELRMDEESRPSMDESTLLSSLIFYGDYKARNGVFMDEEHSTPSSPLSYFLI